MNPPTTLTNHNPPATIGCGLNPNPIRREESDTPQCLNTEDFADLLEAQVVLEDWRTEYNTYRPHQSLTGLTPAAYAAHWNTHQHQPTHP